MIFYNKNEIILYCNDVLTQLKEILSESINLIVSSPPYNLEIDYGINRDNNPFDIYLEWHREVLKQCYHKLTEDGRLAWQIGATRKANDHSGTTYFPLQGWVQKSCQDIGYTQRGEIIWNKKHIPTRTAWGSYASCSDPNILPSWEYIELFSKTEKKLQRKGTSDITPEEFIKWTDGMWEIKPETQSNHPAPFPYEIPYRLLKMFSYIGDIVMDPFSGSGTTMIVCRDLKRKFVGIENNEIFCENSVNRLKSTKILF